MTILFSLVSGVAIQDWPDVPVENVSQTQYKARQGGYQELIFMVAIKQRVAIKWLYSGGHPSASRDHMLQK